MVTKVHGGIPNEFQNLTGHLTYMTITGTGIGFNALAADGTTPVIYGTNKDSDDKVTDTIDPNSAAATVQKVVQGRSTVVIYRADSSSTIYVAVENAGDAWFFAPAPDGGAGVSVTSLVEDLVKAGFADAAVAPGDFAVA